MRIALVYNRSAGNRVYERDDLTRLFRERGYDIETYGQKHRDVAAAIATRPDVLVAAGGDGTVARSAIALCDLSIPLFVLPLGTSNNIARTLGIGATVPVLIDALPRARQRQLDVGQVSSAAGGGQRAFVEAAGVGFIGAMLRNDTSARGRLEYFARNILPSRKTEVEKSRAGVARLIRRQPVRRYQVSADGEDLSADYVTVEVMNIRATGPRVILAPNADSGDARLDLVLVRPEDRDALVDYVLSGSAPARVPPLVYRRIRWATLSWYPRDAHIDDERWPTDDSAPTGDYQVRVSLKGKVNVLVG